MFKLYQVEAEFTHGNMRFNVLFKTRERAEQHVQDLNKPFVSVLDGREYPPMGIEAYKIIEVGVIE